MNPADILSLFLDGTQVILESAKVISILGVNILGIGALTFWGISRRQTDQQGTGHEAAYLSMGICGFVLISDIIVAISRIWYSALSILSSCLLILAFLALLTGIFLLVKKNSLSDPASFSCA